MKIIYGINNIGRIKKPVVAMGVFDGVHRGHRQILKAAVLKARQTEGSSVALTFWPHPQREQSLYSLEHRLRLIADLGIDICIIVNFNSNFAKIKAEDFVKNILVDKIKAIYIYVGRNFRFGSRARGDLGLLMRMSRRYNFRVEGFNIIKVNGLSVSSTLIRRLINRGSIKEAEKLLARPVSILGTVIKGTSLGRILGYPTANIDPHHEIIPPSGIYAVKVILGKDKFKGACYIGTRPTVNRRSCCTGSQAQKIINVEVHIFNFHRNIYSKNLEIQFAKRIRLDQKFPSLASLATQIKKDIITAKKILN